MKKFLFLLLCAIMSLPAIANTFRLERDSTSEGVWITGIENVDDPVVVIPETIEYDGKICDVLGIDGSAWGWDSAEITTLILPDNCECYPFKVMPVPGSGGVADYYGNPYLQEIYSYPAHTKNGKRKRGKIGTIANCSNLKTIILNNMELVDNYEYGTYYPHFKGCDNLETVIFTNTGGHWGRSIQNIDFFSLKNVYCPGLELPAGVTPISYETDLVPYYGMLVDNYDSGNDMRLRWIFPSYPTTPGGFDFGEGVPKYGDINYSISTIGENVFTGREFEWIKIPASIKEIQANAFRGGSIQRVYIEQDWNTWRNVKFGNVFSVPYQTYYTKQIPEVYIKGTKITSAPDILTDLSVLWRDYVYCGMISSLKDEVVLPEGLKHIGAYAFSNHKEIYSVTLPKSLETIGEDAFAGCELLENLTFPDGFQSIGKAAFENCTALTEISLPETTTSIGAGAFQRCTSLEKAMIPSLSGELKLKGATFGSCSALSKVYLPADIEEIESDAFDGCSSLEEITLPATLKSIGDYAFRGCSFSKISLPRNLIEIGSFAFSHNKLNIIQLPDNLGSIGEYAFAYNPEISDVVIPQSVTSIGKNAFRGSNICRMVIPDQITDLPSGSCGAPGALTIGSGVTSIAADAFAFDNLHVIRMMPQNPPALSDALSITPAQNDALTMIVNDGRARNFSSNARWKQIDNIIEEGASDIVVYMTGDYALSEEIRTTTGYMPSNVVKMKVVGPLTETDLRIIKENMISLMSLDLSDVTNLTDIPQGQFKGSLLSDLKLPKKLQTIGDEAFADCRLLQFSELPEGITSIGNGAFRNSLNVTLSSLPETLKALGSYAFENCALMESIDLSKTALTEISAGTFSGCKSLEEVMLPESVTAIAENAFSGTALRDISFAENVTAIGANAFSDCRRLVTVKLPEKVSAICAESFANCPRLIAASMPASTKTMAENVFNGDNKLANISCAATEAPAAEAGAFDGIRTRYVSLTVPTTSYRSYLNAPQWGKFQSIQNRIPVSIDNGVDVTNIAEEEFQEMVKEDELEASAEESSQARRRAVARSKTYDGTQFAALFDGAQIQTGNEGKGTRIFVNPHPGVSVTSITFNGEEMLSRLEDNSLLLPAKSQGTLVIRTNAPSEIAEISHDSDKINGVYDLKGTKIATSIDGLPRGIYIVRQGATTRKVIL